MKYFKAAATVCGLALLGAALTCNAFADESNKKTVITFSGPVEIPGVHLVGFGVLPAGTYVFKLMDSLSDRHIVQIFNQDESIVYATILAIPNYRLKTTDKTVITFRERPAGEPEALRAWFYPGDNYGQEFVYGKAKAMELAKTSDTPVLFTKVEPVETSEPVASMDNTAVAEMKAAPVLAVQSTGDEVALAEVVTPLPPEMAPVLPATGSNTPLIALFGLISLGGAVGLGALAKRLS
jgi:LPXTG-motif cell wall-anchored protein